MRDALNSNPIVQIAVICVLLAGVAFFVLSSSGGGEEESEGGGGDADSGLSSTTVTTQVEAPAPAEHRGGALDGALAGPGRGERARRACRAR